MTECNGPDCQLKTVKDDMAGIRQDVKDLTTQNSYIAVIANDIKHIREDIKEMKQKVHDDNDEIFTRLRAVEATVPLKANATESISKRDVGIIVTVMGVIVSAVNILLLWLVRVAGK